TPDGRWALVAVQGPGELAIVDTASNSVVATVPVGMLPHWIAIAPDRRTAWVANEGANDVSLGDLSTPAVTPTLPARALPARVPGGSAPRRTAVQPVSAPRAAAPAVPTAGRTQTKTVTIGGMSFADHGTRDVGTLRVVKMEADDYYFGPTFLRGKPGQRLRLRLQNEAGTLPTLTIPR